jgi:hypothetical protein
MWSSASDSDDDNQHLDFAEQDDLGALSMFHTAPLMRSMGSSASFLDGQHSLNQDTTRGAMGGASLFFDDNDASFWGTGVEEQDPLGIPGFGNAKELEPDFGKLKLGGSVEPARLVARVVEPSSHQADQVPLDNQPFFVEKNSSFFTQTSSAELLASLVEIFGNDDSVDAEPFSHQHRMKGLTYDRTSGASVSFRVQVYRSETEGQQLVEFQRRQGCVKTFFDFYERTLGQLGLHVLRPFLGETAKKQEFFDLPDLSAYSGPVDMDTDTAECLLAMSSSTCADVQLEGLSSLASIADNNANAQTFLVDNHLVDTLRAVEAGLCALEDKIRHAAALLATSLCQQEACRETVATQLLSLMMEELAAPASLQNRATKRLIASALVAISSTHASALPSNLDALKIYSQCADLRLRGSVNEVLNNHIAHKISLSS